MTAADAKPPMRWYQFRLRTLLVGTMLIAGLLTAWRVYLEPYRQQRRAMALVKELGGSYETVEASTWHRRLLGADLQNVTLVNLADCDQADEYLPHIERLPCLEILAVGDETFGDEQLRRLRVLKSLRLLVLDSTAVSDEAVAELRSGLPALDVYQSQRRAIARVRQQGVVFYVDGGLSPQTAPKGYRQRLPVTLFLEAYEVRSGSLGRTIGNDALRHIAKLLSLEILDLDGSQVSDAGLLHLVNLQHLKQLSLGGTQVSDKGLHHLNSLVNLSTLLLRGTRVTPPAVEQLQKALPNCRIPPPRGL